MIEPLTYIFLLENKSYVYHITLYKACNLCIGNEISAIVSKKYFLYPCKTNVKCEVLKEFGTLVVVHLKPFMMSVITFITHKPRYKTIYYYVIIT